eukprot:TRINITY_DN32696_c0_g1_i2.p1 TRINITY_DN32696_c0_g1~~TRINITY_DN32696_c0_g1_i2.p1  ORF type:complete len:308 (+),score=34.82 TRINITY_DN32696_c0_g1_i2:114-1037(+)
MRNHAGIIICLLVFLQAACDALEAPRRASGTTGMPRQLVRTERDSLSVRTPRGRDYVVDENPSALRSWFEANGVSEAVRAMRQPNPDIGDGTVDSPQWRYLDSACMHRRQRLAAAAILQQGCRHVVEIGGYRYPLDGFLNASASKLQKELPMSYINIDPSTLEAEDKKMRSMRSVRIPMTLADFISADEFRAIFSLNSPDICVCALSLWDPHTRTQKDRWGLHELFRNASLLVVSAAEDEQEHLDRVESIAKKARGLEPDATKSVVVNCSAELKDEATHWPGDEVERLDVLQRGPPVMLKLTEAALD